MDDVVDFVVVGVVDHLVRLVEEETLQVDHEGVFPDTHLLVIHSQFHAGQEVCYLYLGGFRVEFLEHRLVLVEQGEYYG